MTSLFTFCVISIYQTTRYETNGRLSVEELSSQPYVTLKEGNKQLKFSKESYQGTSLSFLLVK